MKLPDELKNLKDLATSRGESWRTKGEEEFNYLLQCPYCGVEQESHISFKKRPYRLKCNNCGKSILTEKFAAK